jgi:hypothetical protein
MTTAKKSKFSRKLAVPTKSPWHSLVLSLNQFTRDFMADRHYGVMSWAEGKKLRTRRGSRVSNGRCAT